MGRDPALERAWRKRMREYEGSGLTIRQFCQQEDLVEHQFIWWRAELKRRASEPARKKKPKRKAIPAKRADEPTRPAASEFVPVHVEPSIVATPSVEIVLDQPPRIRVAPGFDTELLREVIDVLERP